METTDKEVQKYLEGLGWVYYKRNENSPEIANMVMGDNCFGDTWYIINMESGFNTGSDFYLAFRCNKKIDEGVLVTIYEDSYGSYSQAQHSNQYSLESLKELPLLMKMKRIV